jgi:glutamyl-Q tRNA(Asp) synthetase
MTQTLALGIQPAWRFITSGDVKSQIGDFVLKRADGCFTYQLAVVVDDALQGITHVVRGADLADNILRQIALQQALGYSTPNYMHTPLVLATDGQKLSKQNGAMALDVHHPLTTLNSAARVLGLTTQNDNVTDALATWTTEWRSLYNNTRE